MAFGSGMPGWPVARTYREDDRVRISLPVEGSVPARWGSGDGDSSATGSWKTIPLRG